MGPRLPRAPFVSAPRPRSAGRSPEPGARRRPRFVPAVCAALPHHPQDESAGPRCSPVQTPKMRGEPGGAGGARRGRGDGAAMRHLSAAGARCRAGGGGRLLRRAWKKPTNKQTKPAEITQKKPSQSVDTGFPWQRRKNK